MRILKFREAEGLAQTGLQAAANVNTQPMAFLQIPLNVEIA